MLARDPFRRIRRGMLGLLALLLTGGCGLLRQPPVPIDRTQDPRIRQAIEARLRAEPSLRESAIRVEVEGARVMLRGSVQGIGAWRCALTNAELVAGVQSVVDYLVLERGPRDVVCLAPREEATTGRDRGRPRDYIAGARPPV